MTGRSLHRRALRWIATAAGLGALALSGPAFSSDRGGERDVLSTVKTYLDAMRQGDAAKAASVLHDSFRVVSLHGPAQARAVFQDTRAGELTAIAGLKPGDWDVRWLHATVSIDPHGMATVWAKYVFYFKGKPDHCGDEAWTLLRGADGWKIVDFADTDNALAGRNPSVVCR